MTRMLLAALLVVGCGNKSDSSSKPATGSAASTGSGTGSAAVAPAGGSGAPPTAQTGSGGLPKECEEWQAQVDKLMACKEMPAQQKAALKDAFAVASKDWAALAKQDRATLINGCKSGTDAILASAKATCGW